MSAREGSIVGLESISKEGSIVGYGEVGSIDTAANYYLLVDFDQLRLSKYLPSNMHTRRLPFHLPISFFIDGTS